METWVTRFDDELVEKSRIFVRAAEENADSRAVLAQFGFSPEELLRGRTLVAATERSLDWERRGIAYNFLSRSPERRRAEARAWFREARRRYRTVVFRRAEERAGFTGSGPAARRLLVWKLTIGAAVWLLNALALAAPGPYLVERAVLKKNLAAAQADKPADAPPPKDSALVELAGWYERWRLLAQRVFRERADLMAPYGLTPGKAPPRLRGAGAAKFGEKAASSILKQRAV